MLGIGILGNVAKIANATHVNRGILRAYYHIRRLIAASWHLTNALLAQRFSAFSPKCAGGYHARANESCPGANSRRSPEPRPCGRILIELRIGSSIGRAGVPPAPTPEAQPASIQDVSHVRARFLLRSPDESLTVSVCRRPVCHAYPSLRRR
jgi:hypothetical protein